MTLNDLTSYGTVIAWCGLKLMMNRYATREAIRLDESVATDGVAVPGKSRAKRYREALLGLAYDCEGQDFVEYALMAGFVAVMAGAVNPAVFQSVGTLFSGITSSLTVAGTQS